MEDFNTWTIDNDSTADWAIRKIAEAQAEYNRLEQLAKQRKAEIDTELADAATRRDNAIGPLEAALCAYFAEVKPSTNTKTQTTYRLLSGTLVQKKPAPKLVQDEAVLTDWLMDNGLYQYTKVKPAWADLKKNLVVADNGAVVLDDTGEVVDGVTWEEAPGKFEVKPRGGAPSSEMTRRSNDVGI